MNSSLESHFLSPFAYNTEQVLNVKGDLKAQEDEKELKGLSLKGAWARLLQLKMYFCAPENASIQRLVFFRTEQEKCIKLYL